MVRLREMSADPVRLLQLLPRRFGMSQVQALFQAASGKTMNAPSLVRRLVRDGLLLGVGSRGDQYRVARRR